MMIIIQLPGRRCLPFLWWATVIFHKTSHNSFTATLIAIKHLQPLVCVLRYSMIITGFRSFQWLQLMHYQYASLCVACGVILNAFLTSFCFAGKITEWHAPTNTRVITTYHCQAKAGMVHSISGCTRGVQVKLWDPFRTRAIPECLSSVIMTKHYTNPRLPYLILPERPLWSHA